MPALTERHHEYGVFHVACGLGGGALGFARGSARVGRLRGTFRTLGGVDVDPLACRGFERLTGVPATELDLFTREQYTAFHGRPPPDGWREATADDMRRAAGGQRPDVVFSSPPCKGLSALLNERSSRSAKYQTLNELVPRALELVFEAWEDDPPSLIIIENVPRIMTRGRRLLDRVKILLDVHGYASAETVHDCGELGGLAQHRTRFLLVARHRAKIRPYLYEPPRRRVRGVGEVLGGLPLPDDTAGGPMHRLPRLQWRTWVRLALIEAGSDWRSLERLKVVDGYVQGLGIVPEREYFRGAYGVMGWDEPCGTVAGESLPTNGRFAVADPRPPRDLGRYQPYGVIGWEQPSHTITGTAGEPGSGAYSVADPRLRCDATDRQHRRFNNVYRVVGWDHPAQAVTGGASPGSGGQAVADPRVACKSTVGHFASARHYGVLRWADASPAVTASGAWTAPGTGRSRRSRWRRCSFELSAAPIWVDRRLAMWLSVDQPELGGGVW